MGELALSKKPLSGKHWWFSREAVVHVLPSLCVSSGGSDESKMDGSAGPEGKDETKTDCSAGPGGEDETKMDCSAGPGSDDETKTDGTAAPGSDLNAAENEEANGGVYEKGIVHLKSR